MDLDLDWHVPGYVVERRLGAGMSGEVYAARCQQTGELVALKRVRRSVASAVAKAEQDRLRREAAILAALDDPHVVRLRGVFADSTGIVLVLDYVAGGDLAQVVARRGRLQPAEVVTLLAGLAQALTAAHDRGLVHGDVSPRNVLITATGQPVLADLGTARLAGEQGGQAYGTVGFLDPAVLAGEQPQPASDVFSLAAVAAYALTGQVPTDASGWSVKADAFGVPIVLVGLLRKALSGQSARRPALAELSEAAEGCARLPIDPGLDGVIDVDLITRDVTPQPEESVERLTGRHRAKAPRIWQRLLVGLQVFRFWTAWTTSDWREEMTPWLRRLAVIAGVIAVAAVAGYFWANAESEEPRAKRSPSPRAATQLETWTKLLTQLDTERAQAFDQVDATKLDSVYAQGSQVLAADSRQLAVLSQEHAHARGLRHAITTEHVVSHADRKVVLIVRDQLRGHHIVTATGEVLRTVPATPKRLLQVTLIGGDGAWRISQIEPAAKSL